MYNLPCSSISVTGRLYHNSILMETIVSDFCQSTSQAVYAKFQVKEFDGYVILWIMDDKAANNRTQPRIRNSLTGGIKYKMKLEGCKIAIIIANGYHEHEFWFPYYRFKEEGAEVVVAGPKIGTVYGEGRHGKDGLRAEVTHTVDQIADVKFDVVYLPGGIFCPLELRAHQPTLEFVRKAVEDNAIIAAICHAQWVLVSAGVVKGRRITCPGDMADDVKNAGGIFVDEKCVRDGNIITAVYFGYLPEQFQVLIPAILEKRSGR